MTKLVASTVYFNTQDEKREAQKKARQRDKSVSQMVREFFRTLPHLPDEVR